MPGSSQAAKLAREKAAGLPAPLRRDLEADLRQVDLPAPARGPVVMRQGTDANFAKIIRDTYQAMPQARRDLIEQAGYRVVVAPRLTIAEPRLAGTTPMGHKPGTTWDNLVGVTTPQKRILIAQETLSGAGPGAKVLPVDPDLGRGTLIHEVAHAMDLLRRLSRDPRLRTAWSADVVRLATQSLGRLADRDAKYFSQPPPHGPAEAFAELVARLEGGRTAETLDALVALPRTLAVVRTLLLEHGL